MKPMVTLAIGLTLSLCILSAGAQTAPPSGVYAEIKEELGFVPGFFFEIPERTLPEHWSLFKDIFLRAEGPLTPKQKELIGIAVAGMKSCEYCLPLHHGLARYHGATETEIAEVAQVSRSVAHWSTFLYAIDYPIERFRKEVDKIVANLP